jgi:magnesium transporter
MLGGIWRGHSRDSSPASNRQRLSLELHHNSSRGNIAEYDVNNPPSMPGSPLLEGLDDVMLSEETRGETLIDIDQHSDPGMGTSTSPLATPGGLKRRSTLPAPHDDVCFPQDVLSEIAEEEETSLRLDIEQTRPRRRRHKQWPDLETLEAWSAEERDRRAVEGNVRAVHVREPQLVDGRLRPRKIDWHRDAEDAPFRFTYFNEDFDNTIHSQTISELLKPGQKFQDLFIPEAPIIDEDSSDDDGSNIAPSELDRKFSGILSNPGLFKTESGRPPQNKSGPGTTDSSGTPTGRVTPTQFITSPQPKTATRGPRPAFWLDVLSPTDAEMRLLSKVFAIHPLTTEDILIQEEREKVELFRNYYFVSYRSYEQDVNSEDYLSPVNMYVVVFREGILSFHFSQTPHPANVRRRIRQLSDYLFLTTDWISYAIIDDVTDAYAPLIQRIEEEVDDIDQQILDLNDSDSDSDNEDSSPIKRSARSLKDKIFGGVFRRRRSIDYSAVSEKDPNMGQKKSQRDVLRQIGDSRKKVMSLYRLLVTKADVVKGFAKRCNEQWEVAPRSEIGLYLGDIQDHIVTMTGNLNYYEKYVYFLETCP